MSFCIAHSPVTMVHSLIQWSTSHNNGPVSHHNVPFLLNYSLYSSPASHIAPLSPNNGSLSLMTMIHCSITPIQFLFQWPIFLPQCSLSSHNHPLSLYSDPVFHQNGSKIPSKRFTNSSHFFICYKMLNDPSK